MFKGTDKVHSCLSPTLSLLVINIDKQAKTVYVETAQTKTKLALVHEKDKFVLRKFNIHGQIAGRVFNNWQLFTNQSIQELVEG